MNAHDTPMEPIERARRLVHHLQAQMEARLLETHISWVLLDGQSAWKIKKPVKLSFLDASALRTRQHWCEEELRLNRRLAPALYLRVAPICGSTEAPLIDGPGEPIEFAVQMRQFDDQALWHERVRCGVLQPREVDALALRLANFHAEAAVVSPDAPWGTAAFIEATARQVLNSLTLAAADHQTFSRWMDEQCAQLKPHWAQRRAQGHVRECHGDLHLANLITLGDDVTAFDGIEFDEGLRWIDTRTDLAFTVMDLMAHGRTDAAYCLLNAYLDHSGDHALITGLRFDMVYRALVRARVGQLSKRHDGMDHLALARRLIAPRQPPLLITHGLSGSGKSTLTQPLMESAPAIRVRSDVERHRQPKDDAQRYSAQAKAETYLMLADLARQALLAGEHVIVDATFLRSADRDLFRQLAEALKVPWAILHCEAPPDVLRSRIAQRLLQGKDASQATTDVLAVQQSLQNPLTPTEQARTMCADSREFVDVTPLLHKWMAIS